MRIRVRPRQRALGEVGDLAERIISVQDRYNTTATPFYWTYTRDDLNTYLRRLDLPDNPHTA